MRNPNVDELLLKLKNISRLGPVPSVSGSHPNSVGMTLLSLLGIAYTSAKKPSYKGIVVSARRQLKGKNRVNLFARVPDWDISPYKSSKDIVVAFGYPGENSTQRLFCTLNSKTPNSQGLYLELSKSKGILQEKHSDGERSTLVACWKIKRLTDALIETHPATMWVQAYASKKDGIEYFHYRRALFTGAPDVEALSWLLTEGVVTVDHLISSGRSTTEKGPLFKINPDHVEVLFPITEKYDLLN